jgi:hypothetical protein
MFFSNVARSVLVLISVSTLVFSQLYKDPNNLIKNGGFEDGATGWKDEINHGAAGSSSVVNGQMVCKVTTIGIKAFEGLPVGVYDNQILQQNLTLTTGATYFVSMDVMADVAMDYQFAFESQNDEAGTQYALVDGKNPRHTLSSTMQTFTRVFKMTKPTSNQIRISISFGGTLATVTIDNVCCIDSTKVPIVGIRPQIVSPTEARNAMRIAADPRGISFLFSDAVHHGYQIYSLSGKVIANSTTFNQGSTSQYRIDYRSLGLASGKYVAQAIDGNQQFSQIVSVMP